jgi:hypothetical protein
MKNNGFIAKSVEANKNVGLRPLVCFAKCQNYTTAPFTNIRWGAGKDKRLQART